MYKNIAFIGGIHGVGKSTICRQICNEIKLEYLSASELIKWKSINENTENKNVKNMKFTQDLLIFSLTNNIQINKHYLLDGHYCLINSENKIINIPLKTFKLINPSSLNIILGNIKEIKKRLEKRDKKFYDLELLELMQESELNHARHLSNKLGVTLNIGFENNIKDLLTSLQNTFSL